MTTENFNVKTRKWEKFKIPVISEVEAIVGKVPITIDGLGNIEIVKKLTVEEKQKIESL